MDGWIKMRGDLVDHPRVVAIARQLVESDDFRAWGGLASRTVTLASRCIVTGLLLRLWSSAREHGHFVGGDLRLAHSTIEDLDQLAGAPGVGRALESVGWVRPEHGVTFQNFIEFNVPKTPAERSRAYRERKSEAVRGVTPSDARVTHSSRGGRDENTENVTPRERVDNTPLPPRGGGGDLFPQGTPPRQRRRGRAASTPETSDGGFEVFWSSYPRRQARANAERAWRKLAPDASTASAIVAAVERSKRTEQWQKADGQYVPLAATFLNGRRWEDELPTSSSTPSGPRSERGGYGGREFYECDRCGEVHERGCGCGAEVG